MVLQDLLEREGVIRYVHLGRRLRPDSAESDEMESFIQQLL